MIDPVTNKLRSQLALEYEWLDKVTVTDGPVDVTWSAHHASQKRSPAFEVSITSLLPPLRDQVYSVATVRHVMDNIKDIVSFLNPGQVSVIAADQPIYAVAKQVQWHWPENYGEASFSLGLEAYTLRWLHCGQLELYYRTAGGRGL